MALLDKFLLELTTAASVDREQRGGGGGGASRSTSVSSSSPSCSSCQISIVQDNARPHHQWATQMNRIRNSFTGFELHHQKLLRGKSCPTYDEKHLEEIKQHQKTRWSTTESHMRDHGHGHGHQNAKFNNNHHVSNETALHRPSRRSSLEFNPNVASSGNATWDSNSNNNKKNNANNIDTVKVSFQSRLPE